MKFDFAQTEEALCSPIVRLFIVYIVFADSTYDVHRNPAHLGHFIAVRTIAGQGVIETTNKVYTLTEQSLLILELDDVRHYRPQNGKWDFWWFEFEGCGGLIEKEKIFTFPLTESEIAKYSGCLSRLRHDWSRCHASALFLGCLFDWKEQIDDFSQSHILKVFYDSIEYMQKNISNFSIQKLAENLRLSDRTLRSIFNSVIGQGPKAYFNRLRLEKAAHMLRNTLKNISEISEELGYSSPYHFSRAFSEYYNVSPRNYRMSL